MKNLLNKLELLHIKEGIDFNEVDTENIIKIVRAKEKTKV